MTQMEINRILTKIDHMEESRAAEMKAHEKEIKDTIREELKSFRSMAMWIMGIAFAVIGYLFIMQMGQGNVIGDHNVALKVLVGKMNVEHPGYVIEDLDNKFNPVRGNK